MSDVAIVGGGIVGVACAYYCSLAGLSVSLIEESIIGGGATAAGMGHIVVLDASEAEFELCHYSQRLWADLQPTIGERIEWDPCGTLWVIEDEEQWSAAERKRAFYTDRGVPAALVSAQELHKMEPNLRRGVKGALHVPGDSVIYAPKATRALWELAEQHGARLLHGFVVHLDGPNLVIEDAAEIGAASVVVANGLGAARLIPGLPIQPKKGHLLITDRHPGFIRHQTLELGYLASAHGTATESVAFNIQPRKNGQLLIGSSRQYGVGTTEVELPILSRMLARAAWFMPGICDLSAIRSWAGLRPATPDSLPIIDSIREGVYIAAGHEGLGITTSLGTGKIIADLLTRRHAEIDIRPFSQSRFAGAKA